MNESASNSMLNKQTIFRLFFFAAFTFFLYQFLRILSPFYSPLLTAITLTLIFYPIHARFLKWFKTKPNLAAGASTGVILLLVVVPMVLFLWVLAPEAKGMYPWAQERIRELKTSETGTSALPGPLSKAYEKAKKLFEVWEIDPQEVLIKKLDQLGGEISSFGGRILKNFLLFIFEVFVTAFSLFFFFRDGPAIVRRIFDLIPMEVEHKEHILHRLGQTLSAVVRGIFITAAVQGLLAGIGFALVGLEFSVLLGFASAFMALVPLVGPASVWIPTSVFLYLQGSPGKALALLLWGGLVVSGVDNFLRPYLIGEKAKLPIFLLFFGMLGGLQVYGPIGILVGPLMIASVMAFAKIYKEQIQKPAA